MTTGIASGVAAALLDAICNAADYTAPTGFYVKLHTGDPGAAGTSNAATETTRQSAAMDAASGGTITSGSDVTWTNVSTSETYSHVSFWSAASSGTFLGSDDLEVARDVNAGDTFTIAAGDIDLALSPVAA